ncbi:MBL fold metallo-hydrolase [Duganella sp. FT80W]|uniref:MBL fold metallo-hydrolase n=1 Tax=Duganella guangzhouensis TaxID=2666084 RepID=A0A6I2KUT2_9BURK|nr:MBL fold metallo-hydrolase [Duganella guangzhouensis]MRW89170.1 MBL fold metallo-hydrolase [Duganella guangzhouensis]
MIKTTLLSAALATTISAHAAPLTLDVFNPGEAAIFPVASVLVSGDKDAVLIDAQFSRGEAEKLVERIRASGKHLTTIYISWDDPDYYFGLDVIHAAFPDAKVVALPHTIAGINAKKAAKVAYWGPILKENAPKEIIVPQPLKGDLTLEGKQLQIKPEYVWIPSIKAVVGGVSVFNGLHVWTADSQTPASRQQWLKTLDGIAALKPLTVVPGHFAPGLAPTPASVGYTRDYLVKFDAETAKAADSAALIGRMQQLYPNAGLQSALDISAKVAKGEMKW